MAQTNQLGNGGFAEGTQIDTPSGRVPVEDLRRGDLVLTERGPEAIATIQLQAAAPPAVLVKPGAFGPAAPAHDLRLASEHLLYISEPGSDSAMLVPVGALINGNTIQRLPITAGVPWYAVGVARHAAIAAEGLPVGAARPDGAPLCARQMPPGPALFALRGRIARGDVRTELPPFTPPPEAVDPNAPTLRLLADGIACHADTEDDAVLDWRFTLPPNAQDFRLVSPVGYPQSDLDTRSFGVAVLSMMLDGVPLSLTGPIAGEGFHPCEGPAGRQWRWTTGNARLVLPPFRYARTLEVHIADWHRMLRR